MNDYEVSVAWLLLRLHTLSVPSYVGILRGPPAESRTEAAGCSSHYDCWYRSPSGEETQFGSIFDQLVKGLIRRLTADDSWEAVMERSHPTKVDEKQKSMKAQLRRL